MFMVRLRMVALTFAAGSLGGLANSLAAWASGSYGLTAALSVAIRPELTPDWLYPRLVWGGLWGFLFLSSVPRLRWWLRGLVFSLGPSAVQLLYVFPEKTPHGLFGLGLGELTPLVVLALNAIWGLTAALTLQLTGRA